MSDFQDFPKMARLSREVIITEKIDGTNAQVCVTPLAEHGWPDRIGIPHITVIDGVMIQAGSRTRWITPEDDNFGFAAWVSEHAEELAALGPGRHFGEWWGRGIQRGYGLSERRFSLFNASRWALHGTEPKTIQTADPRITRTQDVLPACCGLVPVIYQGMFTTEAVEACLHSLKTFGSAAAPGFMNPEGVVAFHVAGNVGFKKTLDRDGVPKSSYAKAA